MNNDRSLIYCKSLNNSSISVPNKLKTYQQSIRKLFLATCRKHKLKGVHVDLFFYWDWSHTKAASVTLGDFDIYHVSFNMAWLDDIENFLKTWEHEFCHIAQLHLGRLKYKRTLAIWNNKKVYTYKQRQKFYSRLPWEVEARKAEKNFKDNLKLVQSRKMISALGLFALRKFIKKNNIKDIKFVKDKVILQTRI